MSAIMLFGVLRMPFEMAMDDELSRLQFYQRAQQAADRLEELERKNADGQGDPLKWQFTGIAGLKRYMTEKQYQAQPPEIKKWYAPICDRCGPETPAAKGGSHMSDMIDEGK